MPFLQMLSDVGMNYTFNRPLLDGTSPARLKELSAIAPRIKDYDSWYTAWLESAVPVPEHPPSTPPSKSAAPSK